MTELTSKIGEETLVGATLEGLIRDRAEAHQTLVKVPAEAITTPALRKTWEAAKALYNRAEVATIPALCAELRMSDPDRVAHTSLLMALPTWCNLSVQSDEVLDLFMRRRVVSDAQDAIRKATDMGTGIQQTAGEVANQMITAMAGSDQDDDYCAADSIEARLNNHEAFRSEQGLGQCAYTGIVELDTEGAVRFGGGTMCVISARPGAGKTALMTQVACESAMKGIHSLVISLELDRLDMDSRLASCFTNTGGGEFWSGTYTEVAASRARANMDSLRRIRVWAHPSHCGWSKVESKIRSTMLRFPETKLVLLDYFALIGKPKSRNGNDAAAWAELSGQIRSLAQQLNICIVLLAQLNRDAAKNPKPSLQDLRDTGSLEQDAQVVIGLYVAQDTDIQSRKDPFGTGKEMPDRPGQPWLSVLKNRNGRTLDFPIDFDGRVNRMRCKI